MTARRQPTTIAPCPCGCKTGTTVEPFKGEYRVVADCGWAGPRRSTVRSSILDWNRRASDAEAERRGALAAADWLFRQFPVASIVLVRAIERGEVLPAKGKRA